MPSVAIFYTNQCDKKKCTSVKIQQQKQKLSFNLHWIENSKFIRKKSIVLTPNSEIYLTKKDIDIVKSAGITILDCSWNEGHKYLKQWKFPNGRLLPPLLAGNPVNYGKWEKLTSLEALSATYFILGYESLCEELLSLYNWGKNFLNLNLKLLEDYKTCSTKDEILKVYNKYISE